MEIERNMSFNCYEEANFISFNFWVPLCCWPKNIKPLVGLPHLNTTLVELC